MPRQKNKDMDNGVRETIISMYRRRYNVSQISRMLDRPRTTISSVIFKWLDKGEVKKSKRTGRKLKLCRRSLRRLRLIIMTERYATRQYVYNVFKDLYGQNICFRTYLRYCRRIGAIRAPNAKKESLTLRHRKMRIAWCRVRKFWKMEQWKKVIFSDECCIKIGQDRRVYV